MAETPTHLQLEIERMPDFVLLALHLKYINRCLTLDLWKDNSETHEFIMREALSSEILVRRDAE